MNEHQPPERDAIVDRAGIATIGHLLIRDRLTGEILVNQRDQISTEKHLSDDATDRGLR